MRLFTHILKINMNIKIETADLQLTFIVKSAPHVANFHVRGQKLTLNIGSF